MRDLLPTLSILADGLGHRLQAAIRGALVGAGGVLLLLIVLAFTRLPFDVHRWLGMADEACAVQPRTIVVLGGSGMPSGPELLRLHRAAQLAIEHPQAALVMVHPGDPRVLQAMLDEAVLRGVASDRIAAVNAGDNTREQALLIAERLRSVEGAALVVTAPENMRRTVLALRKAGLPQLCGAAAWDHAMFHDFRYDHDRIGGKGWMPDVAARPGLRYTFWNYLKLEVTCIREWTALAYYRLNGWI